MKGKLDASVNTIISETDDYSTPFVKAASRKETRSWTMPFEIKTGRPNIGMEHRAQTMLYTLLMAERYGVNVPSGLLYYTQSEEVVRVPAARNEIRALVIARNEMALYMMRRAGDKSANNDHADNATNTDIEADLFLPQTIDDARICGKCYTLDACMLYRKV